MLCTCVLIHRHGNWIATQASAAKALAEELQQKVAQDKLEHETAFRAVQTENESLQAAVSQIEQELLRRKSKFESLQAVAEATESQLRETLAAKEAELAT